MDGDVSIIITITNNITIIIPRGDQGKPEEVKKKTSEASEVTDAILP